MPKSEPIHDTAIVEVIALSGFDRALAYAVPPTCHEGIKVGSLVRIPLRRRSELGVVLRFGTEQVVPPGKLKMLFEVVQPYPVLPLDLMELFRWAQQYYAATPEAILETIIPAAIRKGMKPKTRLYISKGKAPSAKELAALEKRAPKQAAILKFISQQVKPLPRVDILKAMKIGASACDGLVRKGFLRKTDTEEERIAYEDELGDQETVVTETRPVLTEEQDLAVANIH
ncbi:MAG: primosomal protein N', partial [Verrucomicrobiota bacterium]|nr:primosomal protein N' [Verrucomicrobiota bacterium]